MVTMTLGMPLEVSSLCAVSDVVCTLSFFYVC